MNCIFRQILVKGVINYEKSILAILATVSIGATGLEAGNAHAAENTNQNYNSTATQTSSSHSSNASSESTSEVYQEFIKLEVQKHFGKKSYFLNQAETQMHLMDNIMD